MIKSRLLFSLSIFLFVIAAKSQDFNYTLSDDSLVNRYASIKRIYNATRTNLKPKIDGSLDDECWRIVGKWDGNFIQQQPHQAKAPSQPTEIKILYDDKYLYVGIICHDDEPGGISPILGRRDDFGVGDVTGIAFDSYNDNQTAFEFDLTAAGQKIDIMHMGEYGWDLNWNAVWDGKTTITDSAWYAEMRIPFTQLRFSKVEEHVWGMHVWRWIRRYQEESQWKLIPIDAPAMVYIFGELQGIKNIPYKRNFEVMPYAKGKLITNSENKTRFGAGIDGKIGLASNFTLDYTINPDFGQVEADPSILNLTSYEVFYDEKRPFFLEGNNILEYNSDDDQLFYSRRIGHAPSYEPNIGEDETLIMPDNTSIINALKVTGKNKAGLSLGIINSITSKEYATLKGTDIEKDIAVEPLTNYFIGRIKKDYNKGNTTIGAIFNSTVRKLDDDQLNFLAKNSVVGGLDFEHNWQNRKYFFSAKSFASQVNGESTAISRLQLSSQHLYQRADADYLEYNPDLTELNGWGGEVSGGKRSGKFRVIGDLYWRSPGVDINDIGYMRQADYTKEEVNVIYNVNKPKGILLKYYFMLKQRHQWSYGGENLQDRLNAQFQVGFKNYWNLAFDLVREFNVLDTRQLRGGPALRIDNKSSYGVSLQTNSSKPLMLASRVVFNDFDDNITFKSTYDLSLTWLISNQINFVISTGLIDEMDNNQYITQLPINDIQQYYVGKIERKTLFATLRAEYFITPELSLQYYGSPYASIGKYLNFRRVENSRSTSLDERYKLLNVVENDGNKVVEDEFGNVILDLSNDSPDFNYQEFRSNFVLRWEYKTGSTFYFVWTNTSFNYENTCNTSVWKSFKNISKVQSQNAFMIKFSYWFSL